MTTRPSDITLDEVRQFFDAFCLDFPEFDGALIARRYATPYLAIGVDASVQLFESAAEVSRYFQSHLDRYQRQGCRTCHYEKLNVVTLGQASALASVTWRLQSHADEPISAWRESYNLVRRPEGMFICASTDHAEIT